MTLDALTLELLSEEDRADLVDSLTNELKRKVPKAVTPKPFVAYELPAPPLLDLGVDIYVPTRKPVVPKRPKADIRFNPYDERHGTINGYANYGCRCNRCKAAKTDYKQSLENENRPIVFGKNEDLGDAIRNTKRRKKPLTPVNWGEPMPFEKRPFDPELSRRRSASSL